MNKALAAIKSLASMTRLLVRSDPTDYYQFLGDDVIEGETEGFRDANKPLWLNLGYWEHARTYSEAARALAEQLGAAAALNPADHLLDVGFGFAEQDLYWVERFDVGRITGVNITEMQVQRARTRVQQRGLQDRIVLGMGSATHLPFVSSSFSKVTALECAFHFVSREQFFQEAFRVLQPGGRLALADGVPAVGSAAAPSFMTRLVWRHWATPLVNYYDTDEYQRKLEACGFVNVQCRSIGRHVFPGNLKYSELRRAGRSLEDTVIPELSQADVDSALKRWNAMACTDYLIFTADKPA